MRRVHLNSGGIFTIIQDEAVNNLSICIADIPQYLFAHTHKNLFRFSPPCSILWKYRVKICFTVYQRKIKITRS